MRVAHLQLDSSLSLGLQLSAERAWGPLEVLWAAAVAGTVLLLPLHVGHVSAHHNNNNPSNIQSNEYSKNCNRWQRARCDSLELLALRHKRMSLATKGSWSMLSIVSDTCANTSANWLWTSAVFWCQLDCATHWNNTVTSTCTWSTIYVCLQWIL